MSITNRELLARMAELFSEIDYDTPGEIDEILREAGLDPSEVGARMKDVAEKALANHPLNPNAPKCARCGCNLDSAYVSQKQKEFMESLTPVRCRNCATIVARAIIAEGAEDITAMYDSYFVM